MSFKSTVNVASLFVIGSILGRLGNFLFRIFALGYLDSVSYEQFALFTRTVQFVIPIFGFELHSPLTRQIRITQDQSPKLLNSFVWSYRFTALIGSLITIILLVFVLDIENIYLISVTVICLIAWGIAEYGVGIARGLDKIKEASFFTSLAGLSKFSFLILILLFGNLTSISASFAWVLSLLVVMVYIVVIIGPYANNILTTDTPSQDVIINLSESFRVFIAAFGEHGGFWIVTLVASKILTPDTFKIFDLALVFITLVSIITSNLTLAILQQFSDKQPLLIGKKTKMKVALLFSGLFLLSFVTYTVLTVSNIDLIILSAVNLPADVHHINMIRSFLWLPPLMFTASINSGLLQATGRYNSIAVFNFLSFSTVVGLSLIAQNWLTPILIPIALITGKVIQSVAYPQRLIQS